MAVDDYNADPDLNTRINGINIAEACPPSNVNDAIRQIMADVKGLVTSGSVASAGEAGNAGTVNGFTVNKAVPANAVFTDTHFSAANCLTTSGGMVNAVTTNGNTYLTLVDGGAVRTNLRIVGAGATAVSASGGTLTISSTDTNTVYTHPTAAGYKHVPAGGAAGQILRWAANGTAAWGADNNTQYGSATNTSAGLMTPAMVTKLASIQSGATNYTHPTTPGNKHVPAGGNTGQVLVYSKDGTAKWATSVSSASYADAAGACSGTASKATAVSNVSCYKVNNTDSAVKLPNGGTWVYLVFAGNGNAGKTLSQYGSASGGATIINKGSIYDPDNVGKYAHVFAIRKS